MAMTAEQYLRELQALLPQGAAWPREDGAVMTDTLLALADEFARVDVRAEALIEEADPRTTLELLADWERVAGLPDPCVAIEQTVAQRRLGLVARLTARGGQSRQFYIDLATQLGVKGPTQLLVMPGTADDGEPATLDVDAVTSGEITIRGAAALTITRAGATATRVNVSGLIEAVAADTPRLDYDPVTLARNGLLIEEARTNLALRSSELNLFGGSIEVVITPDVITAPDGSLSGDRMADTAVANVHQVSQAFATVLDGQTIAVSAWAKAGTLSYISFGITRRDGSVPSVWFNVADGTVGTINAGITASIEAFQNGWYRCVAIVPVLAGATAPLVHFRIANGDSTTGYAGNGGYVYYWGMQVELGAFPTSYIPTAGATVARAADVPTVSDISGFFNASEGTLLVEGLQNALAAFGAMASFNNGTALEAIQVRRSGDGLTMALEVNDGGVSQAFVSAIPGMVAGPSVRRVAAAYKTNDFAAYGNGGASGTDGAGSLPTVDRLGIGHRHGDLFFNGHLRRFSYFRKRLADSTLQALALNGPSFTDAPVTITEFSPHDVDDDVDEPLYGNDWQFAWQLNARADQLGEHTVDDTVDDPLGWFGDERFECVINRARPAHTHVIFAYQ